MEYTVGQVVYSKSGHDKGKSFIIISIEGEYLYLVDGKSRRIDKPKKKKMKHVQITGHYDQEIKAKLENDKYILDADFAKALKQYGNQRKAQ
ncbi:hypothetical protein IMSAG049_00835 [Clostridiales bacterium]|nr:hypothetical protein IMSAG049_00835 [Clostridiales bacterium]